MKHTISLETLGGVNRFVLVWHIWGKYNTWGNELLNPSTNKHIIIVVIELCFSYKFCWGCQITSDCTRLRGLVLTLGSNLLIFSKDCITPGSVFFQYHIKCALLCSFPYIHFCSSAAFIFCVTGNSQPLLCELSISTSLPTRPSRNYCDITALKPDYGHLII